MASRVGLSREHVFATALEMADEQGLNELTIAGLAARLGIQRQSIHAHVGTRESLLQNIRIHHFRLLAARLRAATEGQDRAAALKALVVVSIDYELAHRGAFTTTRTRPGPEDVELWAAYQEVMKPALDVLAEYGVRDKAATIWFRAFYAIVVGYTTLATGPLWDPVPAEETLHALIASLAQGLEGAGPSGTSKPAATKGKKAPALKR